MIRFVWAELRYRKSRTIALILGIVVAVTSFGLLSAATATSRLRVTGTVEHNFRSTYDILVRPHGTATGLERRDGLVRPNFLSGTFGGISLRQYSKIQQIPGVDVAAPIAMIGYVVPSVPVSIDLTDQLGGSAHALFKVTSTWATDRGNSRYSAADTYAYLTRSPLTFPRSPPFDVTERQRRGGASVVCPAASADNTSGPFPKAARSVCVSTVNGLFGTGASFEAGHAGVTTNWPFTFLLAAIDPRAEAELAGTDRAIVGGRYLRVGDAPTASGQGSTVPVLASTRPFLDEQTTFTVERLPDSAADAVASGRGGPSSATKLVGHVVKKVEVDADQIYQRLLDQLSGNGQASFFDGIDGYWSATPTEYIRSGGVLTAKVQNNPNDIWRSDFQSSGYVGAPIAAQDPAFRRLIPHPSMNAGSSASAMPVLRTVGIFDPSRLPGFSDLSQVPLETYRVPSAEGGDAPSRHALQNEPLLPDGNPASYLSQPPLLLTTLASLPTFVSGSRYAYPTTRGPISAIRVRVAGVTGADELSRERVRQVAQQIAERTNLEVDITVGSSPSLTTVRLPAGEHGRPALSLVEGWTKKGVAVTIMQAVDRKSALLLGLVLIVCAIFVGNAANAAVRTRRTQLAVLACQGWSRSELGRLVLVELAMVGAVAGAIGSAVAWPLAWAADVDLSLPRALLAIPVAGLLAAMAGIPPALQAAGSDPAQAVRPAVVTSHYAGHGRGVGGLAFANLLRVPGRTALGVVALAVASAGIMFVLAVTFAFRGTLAGSLLGSAISLQIRGVDQLAVMAAGVLGLLSLADLLFISIRERSQELATLAATGWSDRELSRLVIFEALMIGSMGAFVGAVVGSGLAWILTTDVTTGLLPIAVGVLVAGMAASALAAKIPVRLLRKLSLSRLLAED